MPPPVHIIVGIVVFFVVTIVVAATVYWTWSDTPVETTPPPTDGTDATVDPTAEENPYELDMSSGGGGGGGGMGDLGGYVPSYSPSSGSGFVPAPEAPAPTPPPTTEIIYVYGQSQSEPTPSPPSEPAPTQESEPSPSNSISMSTPWTEPALPQESTSNSISMSTPWTEPAPPQESKSYSISTSTSWTEPTPPPPKESDTQDTQVSASMEAPITQPLFGGGAMTFNSSDMSLTPVAPPPPSPLDSFTKTVQHYLAAAGIKQTTKPLSTCAQDCLDDGTCKTFYFASADNRCNTSIYMPGDYDEVGRKTVSITSGSEYDFYQKKSAQISYVQPVVTDSYNVNVETLPRYRLWADQYYLKDTNGPTEVTSSGISSNVKFRLVATGETNEYYLMTESDKYLYVSSAPTINVTTTRSNNAKWRLTKFNSIYYVRHVVSGQYVGHDDTRAFLQMDHHSWYLLEEGQSPPAPVTTSVSSSTATPTPEPIMVAPTQPAPTPTVTFPSQTTTTVTPTIINPDPYTTATVTNQYALQYTPPLRPRMYQQFLYTVSPTSIQLTSPTQKPAVITLNKANGVNTYLVQIGDGQYLRSKFGPLELTTFAPPYEQCMWVLEQDPTDPTAYSLINKSAYGSYVLFVRETIEQLTMIVDGQTYTSRTKYVLATTSPENIAALDKYGAYRWIVSGITYTDPSLPVEPLVLKKITEEKTVEQLAELAAARYNADNVQWGITKKYDVGVVVDDDSVDISFLYYKGTTFDHIDARRYNYNRDTNKAIVYLNNDGRNSGLKVLPTQLTSQYTAVELFDVAKNYYLTAGGGSFASYDKSNPINATTVDYFFMDSSKGYQLRRYVFQRNATTSAIEVASQGQGAQDSGVSLIQYKPAVTTVAPVPLFEGGHAIYVMSTPYGTYMSRATSNVLNSDMRPTSTDINLAYRMAFVKVGTNRYKLVTPEGKYLTANSTHLVESVSGSSWYVESSTTNPLRILSIQYDGNYLVSGMNGTVWYLHGTTGLNTSGASKGWSLTKVGST